MGKNRGVSYNGYRAKEILDILKRKDELVTYYERWGDTNMFDLVLDMENIISACNFTDTELFILEKLFVQGYTRKQVASMLKVTRQAIERKVFNIEAEIERVLAKHQNKKGNNPKGACN
ncbi:hypothetical protein [Clostridium felsineum]|uniref:hypothetical protein n=1 Tax=Clostridium felsineum TaxID=36839 RepID=UPI00098CE245|nr:hypothetical protein [Clostridium felsineum]URZ16881.1 hypothetical protein CLFE_029280 [Clostridium felsineum DSM 794]